MADTVHNLMRIMKWNYKQEYILIYSGRRKRLLWDIKHTLYPNEKG